MSYLTRKDNPRRFEATMKDGADTMHITVYPTQKSYGTTASVHLKSIGPRGGEYPFAFFSGGELGMKRLDLLIEMLEEARERAFGPR